MAKRLYFAFHYQDVIDFRANVVRNSWVTYPDRQTAGFFDASIWEESKKSGDIALKRLINSSLENTSITAVLIGSETYQRRWVRYEIMKSMFDGNKIIGIHINSITGKDGRTKSLGPNPFQYLAYQYSADGESLNLYEASGGNWVKYVDLPSYNLANTAPPHLRCKFFNFTNITVCYDWIKDDGYKKLGEWVDS